MKIKSVHFFHVNFLFRIYRSKFLYKVIVSGFVIILLIQPLLFALKNEPEGFRGIKWGTNIAELPDMRLLEDAGNSKYYIRKNDKMKIGDADLERVVYGFYEERFFAVLIDFNELSNFLKIKETLFQQYGVCFRPNEFTELYYWMGIDVYIGLKYNEFLAKGDVVYFFKPIQDEMADDEKENAKKGTSDL